MTTEQAAVAAETCPTCGAMPTYRCRTRTLRRLTRCHHKRILAHLAEQGRLLASERDDLIAAGVDPSDLAVPLHPTEGN